jgi:hypothetical protein
MPEYEDRRAGEVEFRHRRSDRQALQGLGPFGDDDGVEAFRRLLFVVFGRRDDIVENGPRRRQRPAPRRRPNGP